MSKYLEMKFFNYFLKIINNKNVDITIMTSMNYYYYYYYYFQIYGVVQMMVIGKRT